MNYLLEIKFADEEEEKSVLFLILVLNVRSLDIFFLFRRYFSYCITMDLVGIDFSLVQF